MFFCLGKWLAPFVIRHAPDSFHKFVEEKADMLAKFYAMKYIESQGFLHCFKCPSRYPLRKVGGVHACPSHILDADEVAADGIR
jgi:hypothetical protein